MTAKSPVLGLILCICSLLFLPACQDEGSSDGGTDTGTTPDSGLPDDPSTVATTLSRTEFTSLAEATAFLYTGDNPIQTGVAEGTIEAQRVAIVRGQVVDRNDEPLSGVTITIKDHSEFGRTLSRADGWFDLAVNGGGTLFINYQKNGYLPIQRQVDTPWKDYVIAEDVVMLALDSQVTTIDLENSGSLQVAQGSEQTDDDGSRQATILFPVGTTATMTLADGTTQSLTSLDVRATEYTVGDHGREAMPGTLPINSSYTYAVELSVDEAIDAGASRVTFDTALPVYVDNFLAFPTGAVVPSGWYDVDKAAWIASDNGVVIEILNIADDGQAEIDVLGEGVQATSDLLDQLGITDAELTYLGSTYSVGKTLWRVPVSHFTAWDFNTMALPSDLHPIDPPTTDENPNVDLNPDECDCYPGSIVELQTQNLGETLPIAGSSAYLTYRSDRMPGFTATRTLVIPLAGEEAPEGASVEVRISIAGQIHTSTFSEVSANQNYTFVWDGLDAYGRPLQLSGAWVTVKYIYPVGYITASVAETLSQGFLRQFANYLNLDLVRTSSGRIDTYVTRQSTWYTLLTNDVSGQDDLGGWSLNMHHSYNPDLERLYIGDGGKRSARELGKQLVHVTGQSTAGSAGDGGPATDASIYGVARMTVGPDGSLYFADMSNHRIRQITPDGIIHTIAGNGEVGSAGDGGLATNANLTYPEDVALGPDGSLYIATGTDGYGDVVRKVTPDGYISTVAGYKEVDDSEESAVSSDSTAGETSTGDKLALDQFLSIGPIDVAPDGSLFLLDYILNGVYKVSPDGYITPVIGYSVDGFTDHAPAVEKNLGDITDLALGNDGSLYIVSDDFETVTVYKLDTSGQLTVAWQGTNDDASAGVGSINIAMTEDNQFYLSIPDWHKIIYVTPGTGEWYTVAGGGDDRENLNTLALKRQLSRPSGIAVAKDGGIFFGDNTYFGGTERPYVFKVVSAFAGTTEDTIEISNKAGTEVYVFDRNGRHLSTYDAFTNVLLYQFDYDDHGNLITVTDVDGQALHIDRLEDGTPTAIVTPEGQYTQLTLDANGYLSSVVNPNAESHQMTYTEDGLLTQFTRPGGHSNQLTYSSDGLLTADIDALGGGWHLEQLPKSNNGSTVVITSAEGRTTSFATQQNPGPYRPAYWYTKTNTAADGSIQTIVSDRNEGVHQVTDANLTTITTETGPDPRFGLMSLVTNAVTIALPSGLTQNTSIDYAWESEAGTDQTWTESITVNRRTSVNLYDYATRVWTSTSPEGYITTQVLNDQGRIAQSAATDMDAVNYTYNDQGHLTQMDRGNSASRQITFTYDLNGYLASIANAQGQTVSYRNDAVGRVLSQTNPNGKTIDYTYDANGNLTQLTLANGEVHQFSYTAVDQQELYTPPKADASATEGNTGSGYPATQYYYNLDKQLTQVTRPDGETIAYGYDDTSGKLTTMTMAQGDYVYRYYGDVSTDTNTGQLKTLTSPQGEQLSYQYDGSLLTDISWSGDISGTLGYTYNNYFEPIVQTLNGDDIDLSYNDDGQLTRIGDLTISYQSANGLLSETDIGNVTSSQSYNSLGELDSYTAKTGSSMVYSYTLDRDGSGRIISKTETVNGETSQYEYQYDSLDQLTKVLKDGTVTESYSYDNNGNRLSDIDSSTGTYDSQDRLLSYGNASYTYSANGELKSKTTEDQTTRYQYDAFSSLLSATLPDGTNIEYLIDGQNRRIGKKVNGVLTQGFLYQGQLNPVAELDSDGNVATRFIYGDKLNVPSYMVKDGTAYRIVSDHLGSVRLVVNATSGNIVQQIDYDVFGQVISDTNSGFQPFGFAGGLYDSDTGLTRFGARDYDAEIGRWTTKDITGLSGGLNLYAYVDNDPLNFIDESGEIKKKILEILFTVSEWIFTGDGHRKNQPDPWDVTTPTEEVKPNPNDPDKKNGKGKKNYGIDPFDLSIEAACAAGEAPSEICDIFDYERPPTWDEYMREKFPGCDRFY